MLGKPFQFSVSFLRKLVHIFGMPADGGVYKIKALGKRYRRLAAFKIAARVDDEPNIACGHRAEYLIAVGVERSAVIMRMGVKVHVVHLLRNYNIACYNNARKI